MDELDKVKEVLKDKQIIRIDKTINEKEKSWDFTVIFANSEKKAMGHCVVRIEFKDTAGMKKFKAILIERMNVLIKGYKNWIKAIKEY